MSMGISLFGHTRYQAKLILSTTLSGYFGPLLKDLVRPNNEYDPVTNQTEVVHRRISASQKKKSPFFELRSVDKLI